MDLQGSDSIPCKNSSVPDLVAGRVEVDAIENMAFRHGRQRNEYRASFFSELGQDRVVAVDYGGADLFRLFQSDFGRRYRRNGAAWRQRCQFGQQRAVV